MFKSASKFLSSLSLALCLAVAAGAGGAAAQTTVNYRPSLGAASPKLDIYSFSGAQSAPVVIYVHGGAWQFGSRTRVNLKPAHFNNRGFIFVSIDYRLVPRVRVEDQLVDVDRAIGWVYENIGKYGGNPKNLHLMGHSAGAHLVSMTGVKPGKRVAGLIRKGALRTVISNDTMVYDIPALAARRGGRLHRIYNRPFGLNGDRWRRLSPQYQISAGPKPAFLLMYSGQGIPDARKKAAQRFARKLEKSGTAVTLFDGGGYSHRQINGRIGENNSVTAVVDRFLNRYSR